MTTSQTDAIRKTVVLSAPIERVWNALGNAETFGRWFGASFDGPFTPGARLTARIVPTTVDPDVAKMQEPHTGMAFEVLVERVEPPRALSFRWHPFAVGSADYSAEPTTLVAFELETVPGGTQLTLTESGFDGLPLERRAAAFTANEHGWSMQMTLIETFLARER